MIRRARSVVRGVAIACIVAACSGTTASSPANTGSSEHTAAATSTPAAPSVPVMTFPPLPTPTPLPAAGGAGALSSINATRIPIGYPAELSAVGQTVWSQAGAGLARFSVATNEGVLVNPGTAGDEIDDLLATPTAVWLADFVAHNLVRLDEATGDQVAKIHVGAAEGIVDVGGTIWVTNHHEGSVSRVDGTTNALIDTITIGIGGPNGPQQVAVGAGSVWIGESNTHSVIRMDPKTGRIITKITVPEAFQACGGILATDTAVWITGCHELAAILRIDPATNAVVTTIDLGGYAQDPEVINGAIWVAVAGVGAIHELERIDPKTNKIDRRIEVPGFEDVSGSAIAGGDLWVSNGVDAIFRFPLTELGGP